MTTDASWLGSGSGTIARESRIRVILVRFSSCHQAELFGRIVRVHL